MPQNTRLKPYTTRMAKIQGPNEEKTYSNIYKEGPRVLVNLRVDFSAHGSRLDPLVFVNIRIGFSFFWALYFGHSSSIGF